MKKALNILATMIAVILLCGVTVSCSKDDNNGSNTPSTVNKTIFVFDPYADNITKDGTREWLKADLAEMKTAIKANGNMSGYRVLVYYAYSSFNAVLFELKLQDGQVVNDTLRTYSSVVQNNQEHLTQLFSKVKLIAPANTYSLIIGGHGTAWLPSEINWSELKQSTTSAKRKSFGGILNQRDRIEVATFSKAMTDASFHPELTIFDCCHMSNIESLYDIRNNTDYVIGSTGEQAGAGMAYDKIWNYIINSASRDNVKNILSANLAYYDTYNSGYYSETTNPANPCTLAGIDCSKINDIAAAMANLNVKYGECTKDLTGTVQRFDKKNVGVFFDLLDYAKYQAGGNTSDTYYKSVADAVNSAVIATGCRGWYLTIINNYSPNCWPVKTICGITTSDPSTNAEITGNTTVVEKKKLTNWWKATH